MPKTIDSIITEILNREGSRYTNTTGDKGGPTKYGITLQTLYGWRKKPTSANDVSLLTEKEARDIYKHNYIEAPGYVALGDPAIIEQLIDAGVNHGVHNAICMLQKAVGVDPDGSIGPDTLAAYHKLSKEDAVISFLAQRLSYYGDILDLRKHKHADTQWKFAAGWFNRMAEMLRKYKDAN